MSLVLDGTASLADGRFCVGEAPDWAVLHPFRRPCEGPPPEALVDRGRCFWVAEKQCRLDNFGSPSVVRTVQEITSPEGLQEAAVYDLDFNPDYERLIIHALTVTRAEEVRNFADVDFFSIFRREKDLDRAIYDGCLTAHIAIPDVRVGDVLEIIYTLVGENPALRGRVSVGYPLQWGCPVGRAGFRVLAPKDRPISVRRSGRTGDPDITSVPGYRDYRWVAHDVPPYVGEDDTPSWWEGSDGVSVSDTMTWSDVSDLFRPGYNTDAALPSGLDKTIAATGLSSLPPRQRVAVALRLVQDSLRYQAVNLGVGGYVPRSVDHIWTSRAGDCKDASRLLTATLVALGIDATPALVSTDRGWTLHNKAPWATAFNHCIVRVRIDGETFWLDPTRARQEGRLERVTQARYGFALPLIEGAELEDMGEHPQLVIYEAEEKLTLGPRADSPARYWVKTTYRGWRADGLRSQIRSEGLAKVGENARRWYENLYGPTSSAEPIQLDDRLDDNELVVVETFELSRPWQANAKGDRVSFATADDVVGPQLTTRRNSARRAPIDLGTPRIVRRTLDIELANDWSITGWDDEWVCGPQKTLSTLSSKSKRSASLRVAFESSGRTLESSEAGRYFDFCEKSRSSATLNLSHAALNGEFITYGSNASSTPAWMERLPAWMRSYRIIWLLIWGAIIFARFVIWKDGQ